MTYEQYLAAQRAIVTALFAQIVVLLNPFALVKLSARDWIGLLVAIYPYVLGARQRSSALAREFYDLEREAAFPGTERHPVFLADYEPDWFEDAMQPGFKEFSRVREDGEDALAKVMSLAAKQVENGARQTTQSATRDDPVVKGWARVQGGEDSCAFCAMLISRGPVYQSASTAGLDTNDTTAVRLYQESQEPGANNYFQDLMTTWHENCDCKVVPVFKLDDWKGRDQFLEARRLWDTVTKDVHYTESLKVFRRFLEADDGEDDFIARAAA